MQASSAPQDDMNLLQSPTNLVELTVQSPPKAKVLRTRRSAAKVKTGCSTCKRRKVKCDEGKPFCRRCVKFGVDCDGYLSDRKIPPSQGRPALLPKQSGVQLQDPIPIQKPPLRAIQAGAGFETETSGHRFRIYLENSAKQIAGPFPSSLWEKMIPQISEMEPFVRHAVIAIGALSKPALQQNSPLILPQSPDYEYALREYGKALQGMRNAIANGEHDLQKALVACLLVFCFESMVGNQVSAAIHAESGLALLHSWSMSQTTPQNPSGKPWPTERVWSSQILEPDLLEAFNALDLQVLLFIDNRTKDVHARIKTAHSILISMMPSEFYNLHLAKQFWKLIMNRNYHFNKSIQAIDIEQISAEREATPWEGSANMKKELLLSHSHVPILGPESIYSEHLRYRSDILRWEAATSSLFAEIASGMIELEKIQAAILQIQAKVNTIMLSGSFHGSEMEYDAFLPDFQTIISLAEVVLPYLLCPSAGPSHPDSQPRFQLDIGLVPAVFLVGSRCRNDALRVRAIEMLILANYREGIWDSVAVGHIARWLRSLEIEDLGEGGTVLEEKRAVLTAINIDLYNKRAMLGASQRGKDRVAERKTLISW